jgi:putative membrane protein
MGRDPAGSRPFSWSAPEAVLDNPQPKGRHITEHLANERTALAWIRTAIAVITLGVAINRFSLFLLEVHHVGRASKIADIHAQTVGIGLVILGIAIMCGGTWHYMEMADAIDREDFRPRRSAIVVTAVAVLVVGGSALFWLFAS